MRPANLLKRNPLSAVRSNSPQPHIQVYPIWGSLERLRRRKSDVPADSPDSRVWPYSNLRPDLHYVRVRGRLKRTTTAAGSARDVQGRAVSRIARSQLGLEPASVRPCNAHCATMQAKRRA